MATLRVVRTLDAALNGKTFPVAAEVRIGRDPGNGIVISDDTVSRCHAVVTLSADRYEIADHGSGNGLFVNGQRVQRHVLSPGDSIAVGETVFQFEDGSQPTVIASVPPPAVTTVPPVPPPVATPPALAVATPPARAGGCAITCLLMSILILLMTVGGSLYALYRAGYLPLQ
ncbi:MAG: FHA domain-containing protein [Acidobacteriota bacterium]|nr:FHA domain-containing protein [Acidobacteriota bacterium]